MSVILVHAPNGKKLKVTVAEGADPNTAADDALSHYNSSQPTATFPAKEVATEAAKSAVLGPATSTKDFFETDPATMQERGGPLLPLVGGALLGPGGAIGGEFLRQMTGTALAPETVPETALGRFASMATAGVAQQPKILGAIPGVSQVGQMASNLLSKTGRGAAKVAEAFSGSKAGDFIETATKGLKTYMAPSMEKAGEVFGKALSKLPGKDVAPTMVEKVTAAITPESSAGNKYLIDLAKRIDSGELISAREALKAKQSLDKVIDTVPIWQRDRRGDLFGIKQVFDDVLSSQSGPMKAASKTYRSAVLKDNMTKIMRVNKHGEYSKLGPMLATLGSSVGATVGGSVGGRKGAMFGAATPLVAALALSPLAFGGAAALGGSAVKGLNVLAQNPAVRQALLQALHKIRREKQ